MTAGNPSRIYMIAEAGVNHDGVPDAAKALAAAARDAGADAVKFQTFRAGDLVGRGAPQAEYQRRNLGRDESQLAMLKKLELSRDAFRQLAAYCTSIGIEFLSTPFDPESLQFLVQELDVAKIKYSSGDITNAPLLLQGARSGKPVILSTGMSTLDEIRQALGVLAFGYVAGPAERPGADAFAQAFSSAEGQSALQSRVVVLHCVSAYPAPANEANLRAMDTISSAFGLPVGYSDHTLGQVVAIAAIARGAVMLEKHLTLDRNLPGPDHLASLEPQQMKELVQAIREAESALGSGKKEPGQSESVNLHAGRRSLVALREIVQGEVFDASNLGAKRPGGGLSPHQYWEKLGQAAARSYAEDEWIE